MIEKTFKIVNRKDLNEIKVREKTIQKVYRKKRYLPGHSTININGDFGLENESIEQFLEFAEKIINFDTKELRIDLTNCVRMWPSAITLFCSLLQWTELKSRKTERPMIKSSPSISNKVNSYLAFCGFYDYVKRQKDTNDNYYDDQEVVKIKRETERANIEKREGEIKDLLGEYSLLDEEQLDLFDCMVLTEVFLNVTEHGVVNNDHGWWVLAQYHPTHKLISLCIADNGIGIRNSLLSGPQRNELKKKYKGRLDNEGDLIGLSLKENVSGALNASIRDGMVIKRYSRGQRRGNGLNRISKTCEELKISFAILSHHGYFVHQEKETRNVFGNREGLIFAGTMYHFVIPAKG